MKRRLSDPESPELARPSAPRASAPIIGSNRPLNVQGSLGALVDKTLVGETLKLLLSSLASSTQTVYLRGRKFWIRYCESRGISPWVDMSQAGWGEGLLHYLTWEHIVMKLGGSALTTRFCAIKSIHLVEGKGDFEHRDHRIHTLINAVKLKSEVHQKLPVNPEMLRWGKSRMADVDGAKWKVTELWAALMVGFHFALRIGELGKLEDRDISFGEIDGVTCITVIIRGPKTDQQKTGVRRTLAATACDMCPVQSMADWLDTKSWHPHSGEVIFSKNTPDRTNRILKEIATENGIDASRISSHSLRAGCAPTLYAAGIDPVDIQRWGRWKSSIYICDISGTIISVSTT